MTEQDNIPDIAPGRYCRLSVTDSGCGMSEEVLKRVFEPFFSTKDVGAGTGLGLSTVHGIVRSHGGAILATSDVGEGAQFDIYLPRHDRASVATRQSPPRRLEGKEHLLLIEDEEQIGTLAKTALEKLGYTVMSASTGEEAIDIAREHPGRFSLIISDVIMPGMTGPEAVAEILKSQPNATTIYMSGYTDDVVLNAGVSGSEVFLLNKPFQMEELAKVIRDQLDRQFSTVA